MLRNRCILWGPQTKGDEIGKGYLNPATLGAKKRVEVFEKGQH